MRRCILILVVLSACAARVPASAGLLARAGDAYAGGDAATGETLLKRFVATNVAGFLANDALEVMYLVKLQGVEPAVAAELLYAMDLMDAGEDTPARERLAAVTADEELPWSVRGRAAVLSARLTYFEEAEKTLITVWTGADDPDVRSAAAVALVALYREAGLEDRAEDFAHKYKAAFPAGPDLSGADR